MPEPEPALAGPVPMTALDAARAAKKASSGRCMCKSCVPEGPCHRSRTGDLVMGDPNFRLRVDSGIELYPHHFEDPDGAALWKIVSDFFGWEDNPTALGSLLLKERDCVLTGYRSTRFSFFCGARLGSCRADPCVHRPPPLLIDIQRLSQFMY